MRLLLPLVLALVLAPAAHAQIQLGPAPPEEVVTWSAAIAPPRTASAWTDVHTPGDQVFVTVTAQVMPGWRMYALDSPGGLPLQFTLDALPAWMRAEGLPGQTAPRDAYDPVLEEAYQYHAGVARVWQALRIAPEAPGGTTEVTGTVRFAACNDEVCLPPRDVPFRARLTVRERSAR